MIQIAEAGLVGALPDEQRALLREGFRERHSLKLPGFLETTLLQKLQAQLRNATFVAKSHGDIGTEQVCWDTPAGDALLFLLNDPKLFALVQELTEIGPIGCFLGRVYRMESGSAHHAAWHSDVGDHRLLALSVNLSEDAYRGGTLVLREQDRPETEKSLENDGPGDAVLFRIDPGLEHHVTDVEPGPPKTAWAGWFRSQPSFHDVISGKTQF